MIIARKSRRELGIRQAEKQHEHGVHHLYRQTDNLKELHDREIPPVQGLQATLQPP